MLSDDEFARIGELLSNRISAIKEYRLRTGVSLVEAKRYDPGGQAALDAYEDLCGVKLDNPDDLFFVRFSAYGRLCPQCSKPLRTPKAKLCAACGFELSEGEIAGPLTA